jgi:hypothetical protein
MRCALSGLAVLAMMNSAAAYADCNPTGRIDARCYPDLQTATTAALAANEPLWLPAGTYTLSRELVIDYAPLADTGFQIISDGAVIDATATGLRVMTITCSGGTPENPKGCFYFHLQGKLFVNANTWQAAIRFGQNDFSDAHDSPKIDHLIVNNGGPGYAVRLNYVLNADIFTVAVSAGSAGLVMDQVQFSRISGAASGDRRHRAADRKGVQLCQYDPGDRPRSRPDRPDDQFALRQPQHLRVALLQLPDADRRHRRRS